jgi:immune inhibitor A
MVDRTSHSAHQPHRAAPASGNVVGQDSERCCVAPSPELAERWKAELTTLRSRENIAFAQSLGITRTPRRLGFDDGYIIPATEFELGAPLSAISFAAAERAPLRGNVRVAVVLVDFSDQPMQQTTRHFHDLFFSTGVLPHGSVQEYYTEVTNGLVTLTGEVVGPYRMRKTLAFYANNNYGIGDGPGESRAPQLAHDAAVAAGPDIDFAPYDNDRNGYVDAFIVVHAGAGGEASGDPGDIWSHKWTLPHAYNTDGTNIFGYLTIPEDAKIGVSAHELGHLLFGFPDLYDTDYTSDGVAWNGGGDIPAHPSAWCKVSQGWASVTNVTTGGSLKLADVKSSYDVHRLWKDGGSGAEYFLIENRQRTGYDSKLPGDGLLVWHIDENQPDNTDENHYKVGLLQADGNRDLELNHNRGDAGDPYPGSSNNTSATNDTTPSTKSLAGQDTDVWITKISASASTMTATVSVTSGGQLIKDVKDISKDNVKDGKKVAKQARKASSKTTTGTKKIARGARRRSTT